MYAIVIGRTSDGLSGSLPRYVKGTRAEPTITTEPLEAALFPDRAAAVAYLKSKSIRPSARTAYPVRL